MTADKMSIKHRLDLRQSQSLVMTPQLQQAIKLLQLNNLELAEFLEEELERNPLLEKSEILGEQTDENSVQNNEDALQSLKQDSRTASNEGDETQAAATTPEMDSNYDAEMWDSTNDWSSVGSGGKLNFSDDEFSFEKTLSEEKTLRQHLEEQLFLSIKDEKERLIGMTLIDHLDAAGYMRHAPAEIANRLGCDEQALQSVLKRMKQFDPTGIFARDLGECLGLQLAERNRLDPAMQALLDNIELLGKHDHKKLMEICAVDEEDLTDMIHEIRTLNPKPAADFEHFITQTVIPDVIMRPLPREIGGGWSAELNPETLPRVLVNRHYYQEITKIPQSASEREFVNEQFHNANWLVKSLDQRAQTILKVASEIIRQQEAFFAYGLQYLKPMVLREVADAIEMHESTVSRVTTNKYIGTPRGLFELKFFFTSAVSSTDGQSSHSSEAVRERIRALIENEDVDDILSDDTIVELLQKEGIELARRTVAKYREALRIPSSVQRRRAKKRMI